MSESLYKLEFEEKAFMNVIMRNADEIDQIRTKEGHNEKQYDKEQVYMDDDLELAFEEDYEFNYI